MWRGVQAKLLARQGELQASEMLAREAVGYSERTDWLNFRADALMDLAEVLRLAGRAQEAADAVDDAVALYKQKGNTVSARRARALLEELRASGAPAGGG